MKQPDQQAACVDHPRPDTFGAIAVIDATAAWGLDFHLGKVMKHVARAVHKRHLLEDLPKARWYLDRPIELASKQSTTPGMQAQEER